MTKLSMTHPAVLFAVAAFCGLALALWPSSPGWWNSIHLYFHDTYVAPSHFAIIVGLLFAFYAGVYGLFPKFFGRNLNISLGQLHFWLSLLALLAAVISWLWANRSIDSAAMVDSASLAVVTQSRRLQVFALTIPIAVLIFLLAQAIFVFNLLRSLLKSSEP